MEIMYIYEVSSIMTQRPSRQRVTSQWLLFEKARMADPVFSNNQAGRLPYQPMICLPYPVGEILGARDTEIADGKPIGLAGQRRLKLSNVEWWRKK
jgi:hypothetical protein